METIKRALVWAGIMPIYSVDDIKDAETENLNVERERTIIQLSERSQAFKDKTQEILASVDQRKDELLGHIQTVGTYTHLDRVMLRRRMRRRHHRH